MAGGLLNLVSEGQNNVILNGNPTKTFFTVKYSKYTNFGLQKFRLDYDGLRELRLSEDSTFKFKMKRYGDLLMDTYLVLNLPNIWSPIYQPNNSNGCTWGAYDFKWVENLGTTLIKEITITCGNTTIATYHGDYLEAMMQRDFTSDKKNLFNTMTGNVPELNDPGNAFNRNNSYPSAFYTDNPLGAQPSIDGRTIYIPINTWFTMNSKCAFPLVSLQYNELEISVTMRPIQQIFQVRDVFDYENNYPYIQPDFNQERFQFYRFLQTPPAVDLSRENYINQTTSWNADIHLISTYGFLSEEESQLFAAKEQIYLIKELHRYEFNNVSGTKRLRLQSSSGMVASWMMYLQRNDINLRNEWSNYTNWPYSCPPINVERAEKSLDDYISDCSNVVSLFPTYDTARFDDKIKTPTAVGPGLNPNGINTGYFITGDLNVENQKEILQTMGILLNGEYRENTLPSGVYNYVEKYVRTNGFAKDGLYCYNFCLNTDPFEYQPSGAINMSKFKTIEIEVATILPLVDSVNSDFQILCDPEGNPIGVNKQNWRLYEYNYNMVVMEERYNILSFIGGNCGLMYAR
tara:strand:+ start:2433 stop:4154 length:1722 start_codon:yes stop_codon:yes gene_type:complete